MDTGNLPNIDSISPFGVSKRYVLAVRGAVATYARFGVGMVATLVITPIAISYLGQEGYGLWAAFGGILGYVGLLGFGVPAAAPKFVAHYQALKDHKNLNSLISTLLVIYVAMSLLAFIASAGLSLFLPALFKLPPELAAAGRTAFIIAGVTLAFSFPVSLLSGIIMGHQRVDAANVIWTGSNLVNFFGVVATLRLGFGLPGMAVAGLLSVIFTAIADLLFVRQSLPHIWVKLGPFANIMAKQTLSFSGYLFIISVGAQVVFATDNILIASFLGVATVTAYAITYQLVNVCIQLVSRVGDALFPAFAELHALQSGVGMWQSYLMATRISLSIGVAFMVVLAAAGEDFIGWWVGPKNFAGGQVLTLFLLLLLFRGPVHIAVVVLSAAGRVRAMTAANVTEAVLNLSLSLLLVRPFGVLGVALGTIIAQAFTNAWWLPWYTNRFLGLGQKVYIKNAILEPLLIGVPCGLISLLLAQLSLTGLLAVVVKVIVLLSVYVITFLALGCSSEERRAYLSVLNAAARLKRPPYESKEVQGTIA